jgi:Tfp pilus assembly protein PilV
MRWLLRIIGALMLLVVVLAVIGLLLPSHFRVERSVEVAASPEKIYAWMESAGALTIASAAGNARVTWTNEGDLGRNPMGCWFGLMMDRCVGADFNAGLANLKRLAESG